MTNPDRGEATIEKPYLLIADGMINNLEPIKGLLEDCAANRRKLVFIAPQFGLMAAGGIAFSQSTNSRTLPLLGLGVIGYAIASKA